MSRQLKIQGLRGLAVLSVIIYHLDENYLPGGLLGVDIFFVISGYLVSLQIIQKVANGNFRFVDFYMRRVRRLFPSYFLVATATFLIGVLILAPSDIMNLSASLFAANFSISNLYFFRSIAYSDGPAEWVPLLHTWSLGVEEQFYIVISVLLWFVFRIRPLRVRQVIFTVAILSFLSFVICTAYLPQAAFYLLPMRMWELLTGTMIALFYKNIKRFALDRPMQKGILLASFTVYLSSFFFYQEEIEIQIITTFLVVMSTAAIICVSAMDEVRSPFLENRPLVILGDMSYAAYLIHFPLIVLFRTLSPHNTGIVANTLVIFTILILAYPQTNFFENKFRDQKRFSNKTFLKLTIPAFILLSAISLTGKTSSGFLELKNSSIDVTRRNLLIDTMGSLNQNTFIEKQFSRRWNMRDEFILVIGDSLARDIALAGNLRGPSKFYFHLPIDDPCLNEFNRYLINVDVQHQSICDHSREKINELVMNSKEIFLAADWNLETYSDGIESVGMLKGFKKVTLFGPLSFDRIVSASYHFALGKEPAKEINSLFFRRLNPSKVFIDRQLKSELNAYYFSKIDFFCKSSSELCDGVKDGSVLWRDDLHLTLAGAEYFGEALRSQP